MFDGEGADSWIFQAEQYFSINRLTEMEKLEATGVCFEGVAQAWLRFEEQSHAFTSWEELKKQLLNRLVGLQDGSILHHFFAVQQQGSMA